MNANYRHLYKMRKWHNLVLKKRYKKDRSSSSTVAFHPSLMAHQNHQTPLDRPTHFVNAGDHQNFDYAAAHGNLMLPMFPPVLPQPPLMPQFVHPHPQYAQPLPMMHNPYGQFQAYGVPVNPVHEARQQAAHVHPVPAPIPAPIPQPAYAPKNRPNREIRPGGMSIFIQVWQLY